MKQLHSAVGSENWLNCRNRVIISSRSGRPAQMYRARRADARSVLAAAVALCVISGCAFGQTTRTNPSASSTTKSIPSSSSTSPNSPCDSTNPTSPCYSANAPRNPCFNALAPDQPCSTATTPNPQTSPPLSAPAAAPTSRAISRAFTADQAKSQIEAEGYSNVSGLQKDGKGTWRGKAVKDSLPVSVTLDAAGNVTAK
jgi:hypothetical protein